LGAVTEATRDDFYDAVADGPVLVDVWGPQCRRCLALFPHVEEVAARRPDLRVVKLEAPKARRICMELKLMGLPAFLAFRDGAEVGRIADPNLSADQLDAWLAATLPEPPEGRGGDAC
jgi:thioredoxin 1